MNIHAIGNCKLADARNIKDQKVEIICEHGEKVFIMHRRDYARSSIEASIGEYRLHQ